MAIERNPLVLGTGFACDAYDLFVINLVMLVIEYEYGKHPIGVPSVASATLVGAIAGQVIFGVLADRFNRRSMMLVTIGLVIFGSLASALFPWSTSDSGDSVYIILTICRFFLGFGIGGEYP